VGGKPLSEANTRKPPPALLSPSAHFVIFCMENSRRALSPRPNKCCLGVYRLLLLYKKCCGCVEKEGSFFPIPTARTHTHTASTGRADICFIWSKIHAHKAPCSKSFCHPDLTQKPTLQPKIRSICFCIYTLLSLAVIFGLWKVKS